MSSTSSSNQETTASVADFRSSLSSDSNEISPSPSALASSSQDYWLNGQTIAAAAFTIPDNLSSPHAQKNGDENFWMCGFCVLLTHESQILKLRTCTHMFCRECLRTLVEHNSEAQIACLVQGCHGYLLQTEIQQIVSDEVFQVYLHDENAESQTLNHDCFDKQCSGYFKIELGQDVFNCSLCMKENCLDCMTAGNCKCGIKRKIGVTEATASTKLPKIQPRDEMEIQWEATWNEMCSKFSATSANGTYDGQYNYEQDLKKFLTQSGEPVSMSPPPFEIDDLQMEVSFSLTKKVGSTESSSTNFVASSYMFPLPSTSTLPNHHMASVTNPTTSVNEVYHCFLPFCFGMTTITLGKTFRCPNCKKLNCIKCKAQHGGMLCSTFQNRMKAKGLPTVGVSSVDDPLITSVDLMATKIVALKDIGTLVGLPPFSSTVLNFFQKLPRYGELILETFEDKSKGVLKLSSADKHTSPYPISMTTTFPFEALKFLLSSMMPGSHDGAAFRHVVMSSQAMRFITVALAVFAQVPYDSCVTLGLPTNIINGLKVVENSIKKPVTGTPPKSKSVHDGLFQTAFGGCGGWAKGVGYASGSTDSCTASAKTTMEKRKAEEGYVINLFDLITNFINPSDQQWRVSRNNSPSLDQLWIDLGALLKNTVLPVVSMYLKNDSVLDMANHVPLYNSILRFIQTAVGIPALVPLICQPYRVGEPGISTLIGKMKEIGNIYASRLLSASDNIDGIVASERLPSKSDDEQLVDVISSTFRCTTRAEKLQGFGLAASGSATSSEPGPSSFLNAFSQIPNMWDNGSLQSSPRLSPSSLEKSVEETYLEEMKKLQFGFYDMIVSDGSGTPRFTVAHAFEEKLLKYTTSVPARLKRLAQENVTLSRALPLSFASSIYVRCDTDRLDVMKVLITGPVGTPYGNGCFEFDICFPPEYPNIPPEVLLKTTGRGSVGFNPNLYSSGKVCLSILNTWVGRPEEQWNPQTSNLLPVLVAIQSFILTSDPYFNEPGSESLKGTTSGEKSSQKYNRKIQVATIQWAIIDQLLNPSACFKDVIQTHFWLKRNEIITQCNEWLIEASKATTSKPFTSTATSASQRRTGSALEQQVETLKTEFGKMQCPKGLKE